MRNGFRLCEPVKKMSYAYPLAFVEEPTRKINENIPEDEISGGILKYVSV
jgi:hypothetical protein